MAGDACLRAEAIDTVRAPDRRAREIALSRRMAMAITRRAHHVS